jgi:hypothetical protein
MKLNASPVATDPLLFKHLSISISSGCSHLSQPISTDGSSRAHVPPQNVAGHFKETLKEQKREVKT